MHSKERDTNVQVQDKTLSGQNREIKESLVKNSHLGDAPIDGRRLIEFLPAQIFRTVFMQSTRTCH